MLGTVVPFGVAVALWWASPGQPSAAEERALLVLIYELTGLVVLHWSLVLTLAIGCVIVMVMKGHAYVADAYPPPGREQPLTEQ